LPDPIFFIEHFINLGKFATRQIELAQIDRDILELYIKKPGLWGYKIYKNQEEFLRRQRSVPKNLEESFGYVSIKRIQRSVSRLSKEGLINSYKHEKRKVSLNKRKIEKESKKMSTAGIYYLFLNIEMGFINNLTFKTLLNNYGKNILFQLFLYPYLEKNTLLAIRDSNLLSRIYLHLSQCCRDIGNISWVSGNALHSGQDIFVWQHVPAYEPETRHLLNFLEKTYGLPWVRRVSPAKTDDNNSLWIRRGANYVSIKLETNKKTATMKIKDGVNQKEYQLIAKEFTPDFLRISLPPARSVKESAAHHLMVRTQQYVPSFLFDLESKVISEFPELEILSQDRKFTQSLKKIKAKYHDDKFMDRKNI
jgi:hypothetical protein